MQEPVGRRARLADQPPPPEPGTCGGALLDLLCDTTWVSSQYDHQLFLNTVEAPGGDAALLRLKHPRTGADTGRGLALTTDGNHRWCALDPRAGTAMTVAEAVLNLACVGARPVAVVNCLNFGDPEHPEVMWQLSEAIDGLAAACRAFGLPVVGGNVSLYNATAGVDIDPTPVVGVLGVVDELVRRPPGVGLVEGHQLLLLGHPDASALGGSAWAWAKGHRGGTLATLDVQHHSRVVDAIRGLVADGVLGGVHDVSTGGLAVALAEMAVRSGVGFQVDAIADGAVLFSEAPSRVVACVAPDRLRLVADAAGGAGVPMTVLGTAGGDRLRIADLVDLNLRHAMVAWRDKLPAALGAGVVQG